MKNNIKKSLSIFFNCTLLGNHKWTSNHKKGIKPTDKQMESASGYFEYSKMWCDICERESELSLKLRNKYPML